MTKILQVAFVSAAMLCALGDRQREPPPAAGHVPPQMRSIVEALAGTWSTTHARVDVQDQEHANGYGEEVWKLGPGGFPFIEENRQVIDSNPSEDYAVMWWDPKAQKIRGIWCESRINDEGCSGFDATFEGRDVVMNGEWEMRGKRWAWREVYSTAGGSRLVQTLYVGEPGTPLRRVSVIRGTKR